MVAQHGDVDRVGRAVDGVDAAPAHETPLTLPQRQITKPHGSPGVTAEMI